MTTAATDLPFTAVYEYIFRKYLVHDDRYQRTRLRKDHIEAIAAGFNPDIFGVLHVVKKDGQHYAVIDGWHRVSAIDLLSRKDPMWGPECQLPCLVHKTLNEALTFVGLSQSKPLTPLEKLKARLAGGDPVAVDMVNIVRNLGLDFAFDNGTAHSHAHYIPAVTAVEQMYQYSPDMLHWTLTVTLAAWGADTSAFSAPILKGVMNFAVYAGLDGHEISADRLVSALSKISPDKLRKKAQAEFAETVATGIALVVLELYNKESTKARLPHWTRTDIKALGGMRAQLTEMTILGEEEYTRRKVSHLQPSIDARRAKAASQ